MPRNRGFDEVMIVNPCNPALDAGQGVRLMGHYYAEPPETYGYLAEEPYLSEDFPYGEVEPYGYFGEPPELYGWGEQEVYGQYEPGYGQYEPVGYLAEEPYLSEDFPYGEVEPYGYYAEPPELYGWGEPEVYGQVPEMVGYGQYEPLAEEYPGMAYYAEPEFAGYVRDVPPTFNAGCPMPTNVAGFGEYVPLEGYVRPTEVSPSCKDFSPQPGPTPSVPETFKPLW